MKEHQHRNREELNSELKALGLHPSGRKIRSDKGKSHDYPSERIERSDTGGTRLSYDSESPKVQKRKFQLFLHQHTSETGDELVRDVNMIFPPGITNYFKKVTTKSGHTYRSSVKRTAHPEQLRWNWFQAELASAKTTEEQELWRGRIATWYFIKPEHALYHWTYSEWADAYQHYIASHANRPPTIDPSRQIIMDYDEYLDYILSKRLSEKF